MPPSDELFNAIRDCIGNAFRRIAHSGVLEHVENHHDGTKSKFCLRASAKHVAFTLDVHGLDPFPVVAPGINARNDMTVVCLSPGGVPLVFVIECKNSNNPGQAQHQIECGIAFCKYVFELLSINRDVSVTPMYFGVAAYRPRLSPKGTTRPKFVAQGSGGILRADWLVDVELPLAELVRATGVS